MYDLSLAGSPESPDTYFVIEATLQMALCFNGLYYEVMHPVARIIKVCQ
jgi:hypothetical protein